MSALIIGLSWFGMWQYVLQHQWIRLPTTYYDLWGFIFAPDQAWAWLWVVNFPLWLIIVGLFSVVIGFIVALVLIS